MHAKFKLEHIDSADAADERPTIAQAHFLCDDYSENVACLIGTSSQSQIEPEPMDHMLRNALELQLIQLNRLPEDASLDTQGVELLNVSEQLADAGITELTFDPNSSEHRQVVGQTLIAAIEERFGPKYRVVHMVNGERLSGLAKYGECTIRHTARNESFRTPFHAFHVDKFLPGLAKQSGHEGVHAGAKDFVSMHWPHWRGDLETLGVKQSDVIHSLEETMHGLVNIWVSLTPGIIEQQPLAFMDRRNTMLCGSHTLSNVVSIRSGFSKLKDNLNHFLLSRTARCGEFYWKPRMCFGEAFLFSTLHTPHSAVWLSASSSHTHRCSGELRCFVVEA
eukprot:gnl/TRDRNA2_/TRDRNA2_81768_c0_seq1.p1 gnl/TRDRNA2_/TRDRNA2_81768_c0~~gnl/TRDRNA2_/TRDRNA2_81768_c0_seq1.p1  ORF type:complete len:336 (+),score=25.19 gnl/TRDRNA2_/TRDRNA2_81768_c0_seq1:51-1058(+)